MSPLGTNRTLAWAAVHAVLLVGLFMGCGASAGQPLDTIEESADGGGTIEPEQALCARMDECNYLLGKSVGECVADFDACLTQLRPSVLADWETDVAACLQEESCASFWDCHSSVPGCRLVGGQVPGTGAGGTGSGSGDVPEEQRTVFRATVRNLATGSPVAGARCQLLYDAYAQHFSQWEPDASRRSTPVPQDVLDRLSGGAFSNPLVSGANGVVEVELPAGSFWGFGCDGGAGDLAWRKTYQFRIGADSRTHGSQDLWIVRDGSYDLVAAATNVSLDPEKGVIFGSVSRIDIGGYPQPIGCATIRTTPGTYDVRYFDGDGLPVATSAWGGRDDTHPSNGRFWAANLPAGDVVLEASVEVDGQQQMVSREAVFSFPGAVVICDILAGRGRPGDIDVWDPGGPTPGCAR